MKTNSFVSSVQAARFRSALGCCAVLCGLASVACGPSSKDDDDSPNEGGAGGQANETPDDMNCPDESDIIDPSAAIDDMEDQNANILQISGRDGGWWTAGDDTVGGSIVPEEGPLAPPEAITGGRCGSRFAMRVTGQGYLDWGALMGITLRFGERPNGEEGTVPYDASARQGVDFWARVGDTSTNQVRFAVSDSNSEPDGGLCVEDGDVGEECFDTFGIALTRLDTTFRHYRIPFAGLAQREFGLPADALNTAAIYTIQFNFEPGAIFDFWVDDISFY